MQIERGLQAMMAAAINPETMAASAHRPNCLMPAERVFAGPVTSTRR
jgi:hypothetical protein